MWLYKAASSGLWKWCSAMAVRESGLLWNAGLAHGYLYYVMTYLIIGSPNTWWNSWWKTKFEIILYAIPHGSDNIITRYCVSLPSEILIEDWLNPSSKVYMAQRLLRNPVFAFRGFSLVSIPAGSFCVLSFWRMDHFQSKGRGMLINHIFMKYSLIQYVLYKAYAKAVQGDELHFTHTGNGWQDTLSK